MPTHLPAAALPAYAELHCRSNFSFLSGASHPEELVAQAQARGYAALALTDECSLAGVVRAHAEAQRLNLRLIVGAEMCLSPASARGAGAPGPRLVLLAQNRRGYGNLSHWVTLARRRAPKGAYLAHALDVEGKAPTAPALAGLPGCIALLVPDGLQPFETVFAHALWLKTWFGIGRAFIAVELLHHPHDDMLVDVVTRVAAHTGLRIVAAGGVLMHARSRKPLQDTLTATRLNKPVAECGLALEPNAEAHLRSRTRLAAIYPPEWLEATLAVAGQCAFSLNELKYEYPREIVPEGETPASWLRQLTYAAVPGRFPAGLSAQHTQQIEKELTIIRQLEYEPYFLTVADIVRWARAQGILCQGRGSAANSLVCYCLGVTEVHPQEAQMLFERFISVERCEPPDIDVDFEHQRREEVIQYIYGKYGRHRAALTAVVICYRPRSAVRDAGRALGIDLDRIDALSKSQHWFDGRSIAPDRLRESGFDPESPVVRLWMELTHQLIGFPRHLSQHPGGFVIARDQIEQLVPVENAAMAERSVVQWDKDDLDTLGIIKVDILALGMLSALRRSFESIGHKRGGRFEMSHVPRDDVATFDMICKADTVGVFQIESRAQMSMLPRLQPRCYYDLVVEVAIVRPGPIQGGMVHPYLKNRALRDDQIDYPAALRPALQRTKGIPIFQEQVMQIAMIAADFTPGEADQLRRAMAAWKRKGGLGSFHDRLVGRMVEKGYERDYAERIFKQMEGFGEYGFPESHAAGFAQLAYASSWIKCHHPDVFLAALLNSQPMGFYAPAQLVRDARAHGVEVRPVCVLHSDLESTLEGAGASLRPVRLGLDRISGLAQDAALRIVAARAEGTFADAEDLARRARLEKHELQLLAQADALHRLAGHRHQAAWAVAGVDIRATPLLRGTRTPEAVAELAVPGEAEETLADYRMLGLSLKKHPLALLREELNAFQVQPAAVLNGYRHGQLARASGIVTHRQRPDTAKGVVFVTLEDDTGSVNVIVWPAVMEAQRKPLLASTLLTVFGVWQREGEVRHLVAKKLVDHSALLGGLASRSRNFR
ncbi:MAG TPA: error-prone DNA polymerase [Rubrivivax sp.]